MKIFVLTSRFPYPLEKGDKLRAFHHIKALSEEHEVYLHSISHKRVDQAFINELAPFCKEIHTYELSIFQVIRGLLWALFAGKPFSVGYFYNPSIKQRIRDAFEVSKADAVYCQLIRMAEYAKGLGRYRVIDFMDAFSLIMKRRMDDSSSWLSKLFQVEMIRLRTYEEKISTYFDRCFFISQNDADAFNHVGKKGNIVSNGIDIDYFSPDFVYEGKVYDLVFVGNMGYHPNVSAAHFIVNRILPKLDKMSLLIAGARPAYSVQQLGGENIHISGWVEDIRESYKSARIFLAPIFWGSGQQNKILEAMAMGIPCIVTSQVNEAIGAIAGESILIANTAEDFCQQITNLQDVDYHRNMSQAARQFIEEKYPWDQVNKMLLKNFQEQINHYN